MTRTQRTFVLLASTLAGMVIGATGAFIQAHRSVIVLADWYVVVPWGGAIVLAVLLVCVRSAATITRLRAGAWLVMGGWLATTFYLATETVSGDLAVSSGVRQWLYLLVGAVVGSAIATLPPRPLSEASRQVADDSSRT